tara:strand:+ start:41 stop:214 length:174 start_codon:yes stop_codon:yes gene_type:complete
MTKDQVLAQFKSEFAMPIRMFKTDIAALNEMFFAFADSLVRDGVLTQGQWQRWANPF